MRRSRDIIIVGMLGIIIAGAIGGWILRSPTPLPEAQRQEDRELEFTSRLRFFGQQLDLAVANSPTERRLGLAFTEELSWGTGMVFVFPESGQHGFWMKDMRYPIDIIWIDTDGTVVHVEEAVDPDTYPQVFKPDAEAQYVLEVPAGYVRTVCSLECLGQQLDIGGQWQADQ